VRFILSNLLFLILLDCISAIQDYPAFLPLPKGLTNSSVTTIIQDRQGFIWLGTFTGLNRYDGYEYKTYEYNLLESNTISNSRINDIILDGEGNLLIGTYGGGLNIFSPKTEKFSCIYLGSGVKDLVSNNIRKLLLTSNNLLFAASDNGLYQVIGDTSILVPLSVEKYPLVNCLSETPDGSIWAGTQDKGLFKIYQNENKKRVVESINIPGQSLSIRTINTDNKGNLWLSYFNNGFSTLILDNGTIIKHIHSSEIPEYKLLDNILVQTIFCNINGNIWMGTENSGLVIIEPESRTFVHYKNNPEDKNSLPDNSIWKIYRDKSGIIWFGTYSRGAYRIDPFWNKFDQYSLMNNTINEKISNTSSTSFTKNDDNSLLIATDGMKIFNYDIENNSINQLNSSRNITHISKSDNEFWVSTWNKGLFIYNTSFRQKQQILPNHDIFKTIKTMDGNSWVATWGDGIYVYSQNKELLYHLTPTGRKNKIISLNVFTVFQDRSSRIWIGTLNGLSMVSKNPDNSLSIKNFTSEKDDSTSLSSNIILSIFQDSYNNIWVGTSNGLNKYIPNNGSFKRILRLQDKMSFEIRCILESSNHNLWLGTNKGLIRYNTLTERSRLYDENDGLPFLEFRNNAAYKFSEERLVLGGNGGVVVFNPNRIEDNPIYPNTIITGLRIFSNPVKVGEKSILKKTISEMKILTLSHKINVFTLEFTAINYTRPEKNSYEYMLEGLENRWNRVGNRRTATYSNLSPGEYLFKVRSFNNDGYEDKTPATLKIIVTPPFYMTWWFRVIFVIAAALLVVFLLRIRFGELKRRVKFSENMVKLEKWKRVQLELEKDRKELGSELDEKNQKLAEVNLKIAHKNEKIYTVHQQILEILPNASRENYKKLVQLRKSLEEDINQKDNWEALETGINLTHDNFLQRFTEKYPKITHKDLKLVAYIRMNMSNKEIASLLNITLRSVESGRYRLRKRLDINTDINLNDFIMRF
jgi:ligand-binding sensor domain-containing protein/DNA-binding CsgD family transcriptional regulator